jgi:hypothetical protein
MVLFTCLAHSTTTALLSADRPKTPTYNDLINGCGAARHLIAPGFGTAFTSAARNPANKKATKKIALLSFFIVLTPPFKVLCINTNVQVLCHVWNLKFGRI